MGSDGTDGSYLPLAPLTERNLSPQVSVRTRQKVFVRFGVVLLLSGLWVVVWYVIPELRVRLHLSGWGISVTGQQ